MPIAIKEAGHAVDHRYDIFLPESYQTTQGDLAAIQEMPKILNPRKYRVKYKKDRAFKPLNMDNHYFDFHDPSQKVRIELGPSDSRESDVMDQFSGPGQVDDVDGNRGYGNGGFGNVTSPEPEVGQNMPPDPPTLEKKMQNIRKEKEKKQKRWRYPKVTRKKQMSYGPSISRKNRTKKKERRTAQRISDFVDKIEDATVRIDTLSADRKYANVGAGFFINSYTVVTNAHVVNMTKEEQDGDYIYFVSYNDEQYRAQLIGYDIFRDVAFLYVGAGLSRPFTYLPLGDFEQVKDGEVIVTVGTPLGFTDTVSYGVVSNTNLTDSGNFLIDATINPGSSGGVIYSLESDSVIGIAVAIINVPYTDEEPQGSGLGMGITVDVIKNLASQVNIEYHNVEQINE